jgi:nucleotide-binding universal stress UspA family protein
MGGIVMKIILTPLSGSTDGGDNVAIDSSFTIGKCVGAHVKCFHVKNDPRSAVAFVGEGMTSAMIESVIEMTEKDIMLKLATVEKLFKDHCTGNNVSMIDDAPPAGADQLSSELITKSGSREDLTVELGKMADLIVMSKTPGDDNPNHEMLLNAVLRDTGRPVLVVKNVLPDNFFDTIAIAWNGSVESSRAISYALPFLERAKKVTLISVAEDTSDEISSEELMNYLSWHGIDAELSLINSGSGKSVAGDIISHAADCNAGLLVMGAYTKSRLRRFIFGAVTGEILENCQVPVLMAH